MDGQELTGVVIALGTIGMLMLAFAIVLFIYLYQRKLIKKNQEFQSTQSLLQEQEIKTAYALLEGQDQERKRIASELHDSLGSILVTLNMYADSLHSTTDTEKARDLASRISATSKKANEEVRKISHSLDSGLLKHFGLKTAINQLMEAIEMSRDIQITLTLNIEDQFSNEVGIEAYRIVQELANNSLKHSKCTKIHLEVNQIEDELSVIYEDNGVGFDLQAVKKGLGLNNIEKRSEKFGGELKIDTGANGSTFIIEIPLI